MGTRGALTFVVDGVEKTGYNHFDSYPSGLGRDVLEWLRHPEWDIDVARDAVRKLHRLRLRGVMIEVTRVVQTCYACPSQWDAWTPTGEYVYVRYRHGWLSVDVDGVEKFGMHHGHRLDGCMTWEEVLALMLIVQR